MAGGPSGPPLAAAVSEAGGLGFLAGGYKSAATLSAEIDELRSQTGKDFGVNLFVPPTALVDEAALAAYLRELEPEAGRYGVPVGNPISSDDDWDAKLELVLAQRPEVVSFTFGCPPADVVDAIHECGISAWCTVTSPEEACLAAEVSVDALVVQGAEAGGHRGSFTDSDEEPIALLPLLRLVAAVVDLPLVAAGGIADGRAVAAILAAGARAAQIGTGFLLCPEAGTSAVHRRGLELGGATALTRAFSGRQGRGIVNRFLREHSASAPRAYPQIHFATAPLRAAARDGGDVDGVNLWAGQAHHLAEATPAAELVQRWSRDARDVRVE